MFSRKKSRPEITREIKEENEPKPEVRDVIVKTFEDYLKNSRVTDVIMNDERGGIYKMQGDPCWRKFVIHDGSDDLWESIDPDGEFGGPKISPELREILPPIGLKYLIKETGLSFTYINKKSGEKIDMKTFKQLGKNYDLWAVGELRYDAQAIMEDFLNKYANICPAV